MPSSGRFLAAVDLGSNSFHLLVARERDGQLVTVERIKDKVQLAKGQRDGVLAEPAMRRGIDCLARFAQRLLGVDVDRITVAGTSALREATNPDAFLTRAEPVLGRPIRILSGREEAELIFLGVSHALAAERKSLLVIDVGGGSTEFCFGESFAPVQSESIPLGCVSLTDRCFEEPGIVVGAYRAARAEALRLLSGPASLFARCGADRVIGTSGTVESIQSVLNANGLARGPITADGLRALEMAILERRWLAESGIPGLAPERTDIFLAGVAAVSAVFEALELEEMHFVEATLQNGLLYDLVGRRSAEDPRAMSVALWARQFEVDRGQAARVKATAQRLLHGLREAWALESGPARDLLAWSCDLHEIGLAISARQHNRHGAYLIENGDLAGFSAEDRRAIALLVRAHRGGFPMFAFAPFDKRASEWLKRLIVLLRLAVILERSRTEADSPTVEARARGTNGLELALPDGWLDRHALSRRELEIERGRLAEAGIELGLVSHS